MAKRKKKGKKKGKGGPPKGVTPPHLKKFLFKKKGSRGPGGARMAKKKQKRSRGQGLVSWLTSIFALFLGLAPVWATISRLFSGEADLGTAADDLQRYYNPMRKDRDALAVGYGSLVGGLIFKVASSELTRRAQVRAIVPRLV